MPKSNLKILIQDTNSGSSCAQIPTKSRFRYIVLHDSDIC